MSTPNITPSAKYSGNGVATEFAVPFPYLDKSYVSVYVKRGSATQVKLSSTNFDFTNDTYIVYPKAGSTDAVLTSNDVIVVKRETLVKSDYVFDNQVRLFPEDVMDADDLGFQMIQEQVDELNRAVKVSETSLVKPDEIIPAVESIYSNLTQISAVGDNIGDVNTCASNITDIQNASTNAATATTKASEASASADNAAESAGLAASIVTLAQEWATKMDGQVDNTDYSSKYYAQTAAAQIPLVTAAGQAQVNLAIAQVALASNEADRAATEASKAIGLEIGSLISSSLPILNAVKYVLADGTQYSTTGVYQAFADYLAQVKLTHPQCFVTQAEFDADVARTGQCGRYVLDTVNFRVPKITRYIGATVNLADIGKAWGESLPNIKGRAYDNIDMGNDTTYANNTAEGAFYCGKEKNAWNTKWASTGVKNVNALCFDASLSSPSYQDGAKVNPERVTYPYYIVVSSAGQMTPVEIDINNVMADLANKANTNLSNITATGKKTVVGWGDLDWSRSSVVTSSACVSSGTGYNPPKSGMLVVRGRNNNGQGNCYIYNLSGVEVYNEAWNITSAYSGNTSFVPVSSDYSYRWWQFSDYAKVVFVPYKGV